MTTVWSNMGVQTAPVFNKALVVNGDSSITSVTAATSTTTGAFTVAGGVGIGGNLFVGGSVSFAAATFTNLTVTGALFHTPANGTQTVHSSTVQSEANPRFYMDASGKMNWGAGGASAVYDATLARDALGGKLAITGGLTVSQAVALSSTLSITSSLSVGNFFAVQGSGSVSAISMSLSGGPYSAMFANLTTNALRFSTSGVAGNTFTIDASGNTVWKAGMNLSTSASNSVYAGGMVFNYLNASSSFYLSASQDTYIRGVSDNITHAGNHTYSGINMFTGELKSNSTINLLNSTSGFKTVTLSNTGSIQWYSTLGVPGTASMSADSTGNQIQTSGPMAINGLLNVSGVICDGDLVVKAGSNLALTGASSFRTEIYSLVSGASKIVAFPDAGGSVVLDSASQTLTNKIMAGESNTVFTGACSGTLSATGTTVFNITSASTALYGLSDANRSSVLSKSVTIINNLGGVLQIAHDNVNAQPEDRIFTPKGTSLFVQSNGVVRLVYSSLRQRWLVTSVLGEPQTNYLTTGAASGFSATSQGNKGWYSGPTISFNSLSGQLASSYSSGIITIPIAGVYSFSMIAGNCALNPPDFAQNFAIWARINGTDRTVYVDRVDPKFLHLERGFTVSFSVALGVGDKILFLPVLSNSAGGNYSFQSDGFTKVSILCTPLI